MKRLFSLIVALFLLIPCTALADNGDLPDILAFSDGLLWIDPDDETAELDYMSERIYHGTDEDILHVANEYITLLTEKYSLKEICHFAVYNQNDDVVCVKWAFEYTQSTPVIGVLGWNDDNANWRINDFQVLVEYTQSLDYSIEYIRIYYRSEFNYIDTGDRVSAKPVSATEQHVSKVECSYCGGDGKCDECGGDMWTTGYEWEYVNGFPESKMVTKLCQGVYCYGGSCLMCDGPGYE